MSNKTLYYCDKCGSEYDNADELTDVDIRLDAYSSYKAKRFTRVSRHLELCSACTEKLGFVKIVEKDGEKTVEPTTADKLYDLIANITCEINR